LYLLEKVYYRHTMPNLSMYFVQPKHKYEVDKQIYVLCTYVLISRTEREAKGGLSQCEMKLK